MTTSHDGGSQIADAGGTPAVRGVIRSALICGLRGCDLQQAGILVQYVKKLISLLIQ